MIYVNGIGATGVISIPLRGAWTANLTLQTNEEINGKVTVNAHGRMFNGVVVRSNSVHDSGGGVSVFVVGGNGKLKDVTETKSYLYTSLQSILTIACASVGEMLGDCPKQTVKAWSTSISLDKTLDDVCDYTGHIWRISDDGKVTIHKPSWQAVEVNNSDFRSDNVTGMSVIHLTDKTSNVSPGQTINGVKCHHVRICDDSIEVISYGEKTSSMPWVDYSDKSYARSKVWFSVYDCEIVAQNADYSCNIKVDGPIKQLQNVPIKWGIQGMKCRISPGSKAIMTFGGNPSTPQILGFVDATPLEISIKGITLKLQDGVASAVLGESLLASINAFITTYIAHIHDVVTDPSTGKQTAIPTAMQATPIPPTVLSATVKLS